MRIPTFRVSFLIEADGGMVHSKRKMRGLVPRMTRFSLRIGARPQWPGT